MIEPIVDTNLSRCRCLYIASSCPWGFTLRLDITRGNLTNVLSFTSILRHCRCCISCAYSSNDAAVLVIENVVADWVVGHHENVLLLCSPELALNVFVVNHVVFLRIKGVQKTWAVGAISLLNLTRVAILLRKELVECSNPTTILLCHWWSRVASHHPHIWRFNNWVATRTLGRSTPRLRKHWVLWRLNDRSCYPRIVGRYGMWLHGWLVKTHQILPTQKVPPHKLSLDVLGIF